MCKVCNHDIEAFENYIGLEDEVIICEDRFFNMAIKKLNAREKQRKLYD